MTMGAVKRLKENEIAYMVFQILRILLFESIFKIIPSISDKHIVYISAILLKYDAFNNSSTTVVSYWLNV